MLVYQIMQITDLLEKYCGGRAASILSFGIEGGARSWR